MLKFLVAAYPDGIASIAGRDLENNYRDWEKETGQQLVKETKFGREAKKVVRWVVYSKKIWYQLSNKANEHF